LSAKNVDFNRLNVGFLRSRSLHTEGSKYGYLFKTNYFFIARCTLIFQVAAPVTCVTWALLRLLAYLFCGNFVRVVEHGEIGEMNNGSDFDEDLIFIKFFFLLLRFV